MKKKDDKESKKKTLLTGRKFVPMSMNEMETLQGSGNTQGKSISEHNFAAKIFVKKGL